MMPDIHGSLQTRSLVSVRLIPGVEPFPRVIGVIGALWNTQPAT